MEEKQLINRVAQSGLITLDLEKYLPGDDILASIDLKQFLVQEMVLMEKLFREKLSETDFSTFSNKHIAIYCSNDALIPHWAYMLIVSKLLPFTSNIYFCLPSELKKQGLLRNIENIDINEFSDKKVVVKGCSKTGIDAEAYLIISKKLIPTLKTLMYGEPCSTVPVYKKN